jgi:diamine N-acetyltransferase
MIAPEHQGRGHGREVVARVLDIVGENGGTELLTSYREGPGDPSGFYAALGFVPTGDRDDEDEVIASIPVGGEGA